MLKEIKKIVFEILSASDVKLTQRMLYRELVTKYKFERTEVKRAIKDLVFEGALAYTYIYGCSFIEKGFYKPVRVSNRVVLIPASLYEENHQNRVVVKISHGASFGTGRHPTTRLSIRAIDGLLKKEVLRKNGLHKTALDIGTGSGVLAIASVKLGIKRAIGIDIESISRKEAIENVACNGLSKKIEILNADIDSLSQAFFLIMANLRYPTLKQLRLQIKRKTKPGGYVVLSGVTKEEVGGLQDLYSQDEFKCIWKEVENRWACLVFQKSACL